MLARVLSAALSAVAGWTCRAVALWAKAEAFPAEVEAEERMIKMLARSSLPKT
jgi:hypothetical protein